MIVFDLKCQKKHVFEAWFANSDAFERQAKARQVACPACGSTRIAKAPMAPQISSGARETPIQTAQADSVMALPPPEFAEALRGLRAKIEKTCDYVGANFAEEARKIHYREADPRGIYGEATERQSAELRAEGVDFGVVPWLRRHDA
jgi:hypothetical protein